VVAVDVSAAVVAEVAIGGTIIAVAEGGECGGDWVLCSATEFGPIDG